MPGRTEGAAKVEREEQNAAAAAANATSSAQPALKGKLLRWHVGSSSGQSRRPLMVLLGWMFAPEAALNKYVALLDELGWDAAVYRPHVLPLWAPAWAAATADALLEELEAELSANGPRPIVFGVFSGAAKAVYYKMLPQLGPVAWPVPDLTYQQPGDLPQETAAEAAPLVGSSAQPCTPAPSTAAPASTSAPQQPAGNKQVAMACTHGPSVSIFQQEGSTLAPAIVYAQHAPLQGQGLATALRQAVPAPWEHAAAPLLQPQPPQQPATSPSGAAGSEQHGTSDSSAGASSWGGVVGRLVPWLSRRTSPTAGSTSAASTGTTAAAARKAVAAGKAPAYPLVSACVCGQLFDSSPVDFTSHAGARMVVNARRARSQSSASGLNALPLSLLEFSTGVVAGAMDFVGLEAWEGQRQAMWGTLAGSDAALQGPSLFCYSWNDEVADPVRIQRLAAALRARGAVVLEQTWGASEHCGHARCHPGDYRSALTNMLQHAQDAYDKTSSARSALFKAGLRGRRKHNAKGDGDADGVQMLSAAAGAAVAAAAMVASLRSKL